MGIIFQIEIIKMKLFVVLCFIGAALAIPNPFLHQWKKPLDWLFQTNTTVKDTAKDTVHHTTTKDTARDTVHHTTVKVTEEDTFHTVHQDHTTQEESSVAELAVTEEDTTRDVTPQSSTTVKLYRWIAHYNKQMKVIFIVKFLFSAVNKV